MTNAGEAGTDKYINAEAAALGSLVVARAYPDILPAVIADTDMEVRKFHKIVRATNRQLMDYAPNHRKRCQEKIKAKCS
jgi:hypothetical protein